MLTKRLLAYSNFFPTLRPRTLSQLASSPRGYECRLRLQQQLIHQEHPEAIFGLLSSLRPALMESYHVAKEKKVPWLKPQHNVPRIFISYAWPILNEHPDAWWVQPFLTQFSIDLFQLGIHPRLDLLHSRFGPSSIQYMNQEFNESDIVLPAITRDFKIKLESPNHFGASLQREFQGIKARNRERGALSQPNGVMPLMLQPIESIDTDIPPEFIGRTVIEDISCTSYLSFLKAFSLHVYGFFEHGLQDKDAMTVLAKDDKHPLNQAWENISVDLAIHLDMPLSDEQVEMMLMVMAKEREDIEALRAQEVQRCLVNLSVPIKSTLNILQPELNFKIAEVLSRQGATLPVELVGPYVAGELNRYYTRAPHNEIKSLFSEKPIPITEGYNTLQIIEDNKSYTDETKNNVPLETLLDARALTCRAGDTPSFVTPKNILIKGAAGAGKTTMMAQVCTLFGLGQWYAEKFTLVIKVPLRQLNYLGEAASLETLLSEMVLRFCECSYGVTPASLKDYVNLNKDKVLWLFDGWDEFYMQSRYKGVIDDLIRDQSRYVLMTSRPDYTTPKNFDLHLRNLGLSRVEQRKFIKNWTRCSEQRTEIENAMEQNSGLATQGQVPMMLEAICTLWPQIKSRAKPIIPENAGAPGNEIISEYDIYDVMAQALWVRYATSPIKQALEVGRAGKTPQLTTGRQNLPGALKLKYVADDVQRMTQIERAFLEDLALNMTSKSAMLKAVFEESDIDASLERVLAQHPGGLAQTTYEEVRQGCLHTGFLSRLSRGDVNTSVENSAVQYEFRHLDLQFYFSGRAFGKFFQGSRNQHHAKLILEKNMVKERYLKTWVFASHYLLDHDRENYLEQWYQSLFAIFEKKESINCQTLFSAFTDDELFEKGSSQSTLLHCLEPVINEGLLSTTLTSSLEKTLRFWWCIHICIQKNKVSYLSLELMDKSYSAFSTYKAGLSLPRCFNHFFWPLIETKNHPKNFIYPLAHSKDIYLGIKSYLFNGLTTGPYVTEVQLDTVRNLLNEDPNGDVIPEIKYAGIQALGRHRLHESRTLSALSDSLIHQHPKISNYAFSRLSGIRYDDENLTFRLVKALDLIYLSRNVNDNTYRSALSLFDENNGVFELFKIDHFLFLNDKHCPYLFNSYKFVLDRLEKTPSLSESVTAELHKFIMHHLDNLPLSAMLELYQVSKKHNKIKLELIEQTINKFNLSHLNGTNTQKLPDQIETFLDELLRVSVELKENKVVGKAHELHFSGPCNESIHQAVSPTPNRPSK